MLKKSFVILSAVVAFVLIVANASYVAAASKPLPRVIGVTSYGVGSAGYTAMMGLGEAVKKQVGISFKVLPFGSDMARTLPMATGRAAIGLTGSAGAFTATYGVHPFGAEEWGPQPLRVVWAGPLISGFATIKGSGIKTMADLRGRRVARVPGSVGLELEAVAMLRHGGLTWDDVKPVIVPGYVAGMKALLQGTVDCAIVSPPSGIAYEIEAKRGIVYIPGSKDPRIIRSGYEVAPFFTVGYLDHGAGIKHGKPETYAWSWNFPYPLMAWSTQDERLCYTITKGIWGGYDQYSKIHASLIHWTQKRTLEYWRLTNPYQDGTVQFFKDIGVWTPEMEKWQDGMVAKEEARLAAWLDAVAAAKKAKIDLKKPEWHDPVNGFWRKWIRDHDLLTLPQVVTK